MKRLFLLLLFLPLASSFTFGQVLPKQYAIVPKIGIIKTKQPLIFIGHLETNANSLIINLDNLKIIKTYTDSLELIPFGEKGQNGVVLAELKTKIPLLKLDEVLDYYKIPVENRHLKVLVDNRLINPELFLADVRIIKSIEITKQDITSILRYSWNIDEEFLNIITVRP